VLECWSATKLVGGSHVTVLSDQVVVGTFLLLSLELFCPVFIADFTNFNRRIEALNEALFSSATLGPICFPG